MFWSNILWNKEHKPDMIIRKDYKPVDIKKECSIEFNDNVPQSIKEKLLQYYKDKGIYDLKAFNEYLSKHGKSKTADEIHNVLKDDPEYPKWSAEMFFKDTLELCIRKNDGSLKEWVIDEALKQNILNSEE